MKIYSNEFENGQPIPDKYTCDEENINPSLLIENIPEGTQSLALTVLDPDAPTKTWVHWLMWNIDPLTTEIEEEYTPHGGVVGTNDFGETNYRGPCPPSGTHKYFFNLYALDAKLDLEDTATLPDLEDAMETHIIEKAVYMGTYSKKQ